MKYVMVGIWVLVASSLAHGAQLSAAFAINTGPFACDGATRTFQWTTMQNIDVVKVIIWQGMDLYHMSDFPAVVHRISDNIPVAVLVSDRYANPSLPVQIIQDFGQDSIQLNAGDGLRLDTNCTPISGPHNGHIAVWVWWRIP